MSGFLQGIALRGAGLYPAAAVRQMPDGQASDGLVEVSTETVVVPDVRDATEAPEPRQTPAISPTVIEKTLERETPPRLEIVETREAPAIAKGSEAAPAARIITPPPGVEQSRSPDPCRDNARPEVRYPKPTRAEAKEPATTDMHQPVPLPQQRDAMPAAEAPVAKAEMKRDEPRIASVVLQPADARPMVLMASPAQPAALAAADPEPRPVEVRIGSIEVRAAAPQKPQPQARATAPVESGFGAYVRMRTYRSHSR